MLREYLAKLADASRNGPGTQKRIPSARVEDGLKSSGGVAGFRCGCLQDRRAGRTCHRSNLLVLDGCVPVSIEIDRKSVQIADPKAHHRFLLSLSKVRNAGGKTAHVDSTGVRAVGNERAVFGGGGTQIRGIQGGYSELDLEFPRDFVYSYCAGLRGPSFFCSERIRPATTAFIPLGGWSLPGSVYVWCRARCAARNRGHGPAGADRRARGRWL